MSKVKTIILISTLFTTLSLRSLAQFDGIDIKDSTYIATFEHFLGPLKINNGDTSAFLKPDTNNYTFTWNIDGVNTELDTTRNDINVLYYTHHFESEGTYNVSLEVINDTSGASFFTSKTINISDPIKVPNVFTPNNGDNYNNLFVVKSSGNSNNKLTINIYSRNGDLIHEQTARVIYWDGKLASGQDASEGVYYYIIKSEGTQDKPPRVKKGFFHLYR